MNILAIDFEPSSLRGGQEKSLLDVLIGLSDLGHTVVLAYVIWGDHLERYHKAGINTKQILTTRNDGVKLTSWWRLISSAVKLKKYKSDVVYINEVIDMPLGTVLSWMYSSRLVCHLRLPPPVLPIFRKKNNFIGLFVHHIDRFIVANENMRHAYIHAGLTEKSIVVIPNGFPMDRISIDRKSRSLGKVRTIGFLGRIAKYKGLHDLIDAFHMLIDRGNDLELIIGGTPKRPEHFQYLEEIKLKIDDLRLSSRIHFKDHISDPTEFLSHLDLCIFPSTVNESFGRVIVESIMAGTPILVRDIGATSEIINDTNKEWTFNSKEDLADKIEKWFQHPESYNLEQRQDYIRNSFALPEILHKIESVLSEIE